MKVDFYRHDLSAADGDGVLAVLDSKFLTTGTVARAVEAQLQAYFGVPCAALTNSWTNGALALLLALDLQPGDEVIIPAMTFIATGNVVVLAGARPVFVDVDPRTLLLTPEGIAAALTERTRAVMPVHLYGQMCDVAGMAKVLQVHAQRYGSVMLIEDCAHCFEGTRDGYRPGVCADAAVFSFYATKNVTCGEGGAVICRDEKLHKCVLEARLHGMSALAIDRFSGGRYNHWDMVRMGTKANLPDLLAALLPRQIDTIDARLPVRQRIAARYRAAFAGGPLRLVEQLPSCQSAEHLFTIGVPAAVRDEAVARLNGAGIGVTVNYRAVPDTTYYRTRFPAKPEAYPVARRWGEETLSIPLFPSLTEAEQDYVIEQVKAVVYPLC